MVFIVLPTIMSHFLLGLFQYGDRHCGHRTGLATRATHTFSHRSHLHATAITFVFMVPPSYALSPRLVKPPLNALARRTQWLAMLRVMLYRWAIKQYGGWSLSTHASSFRSWRLLGSSVLRRWPTIYAVFMVNLYAVPDVIWSGKRHGAIHPAMIAAETPSVERLVRVNPGA